MRGYQTGGRDKGPIVVTDQSTNAGPTSMAITLIQGNGGIRTLDDIPYYQGGGGTNVITNKMMFF